MDFHMFAVVIVLLACVEQSLASCVVDSFTVKQDFDPARVSTQTCLLEILRYPRAGQSLEALSHSALMTELICNTHMCNPFSGLLLYLLYLYFTL